MIAAEAGLESFVQVHNTVFRTPFFDRAYSTSTNTCRLSSSGPAFPPRTRHGRKPVLLAFEFLMCASPFNHFKSFIQLHFKISLAKRTAQGFTHHFRPESPRACHRDIAISNQLSLWHGESHVLLRSTFARKIDAVLVRGSTVSN